MKHGNDKLGIIIAIVITAGAITFVGSTSEINDRNMQAQGERVLEKTSEELLDVPSTLKEKAAKTLDNVDDIDTVGEAIDKIGNAIPDTSPIIKKTQGKLLEIVAIPSGTAVPGCEQTNTCFIPAVAVMKRGGEVIWENHDNAAHTVTSGSPTKGPNILFDSGLIVSGGTFSIKLDLPGEYDYYCLVHPWMSGKIIVQ